jgi:pimeloyl-ACP methyl ester carboxylesterase
MDMLHLANAVGVNDKFWVVGYSSGSLHAWAALRYIPDRLAGIPKSVLISLAWLECGTSIINSPLYDEKRS